MLWNAVVLAIRAVLRNKMRSFLTVLGIVIGVAAVITMVTVGNGATLAVVQQIESLGSNLLMVSPGRGMGPGVRSGGSAAFDVRDAAAIVDQVSGVRAVAPNASRPAVAIFMNENWSTTVTGIDSGYLKVRDWPIVHGRTFTDGELRAGSSVCLIGETIRAELFGPLDPIGAQIRFGKVACAVVGLLEAKGQSSFGQDQDNAVLMPLKGFQRRVAGKPDITSIMVSLHEGVSSDRAQGDIERLMRERRRISPGEDDDFSVRDTREIMAMMTSATTILTAFLGAVAGVSLLVGGIGIMNIMLVSVTERTREIGIRLAIGALERDVLLQFLVEAVVLSSFGGLIGIALALTGSVFITDAMNVPLVIDPTIVVGAFAFSAMVGVVFGFFPARRAATLNPIDALRYE